MAYQTAPDPKQTKFPGGVPFIIGNELAERFSFYGMKGILTVFMTQHLLNSAGEPAYMNESDAKSVYHLFTAGAYFFPLIGAIVSDVLWGKYKTILYISLMYCVGHGMLALMDIGPEFGLWDMKPFLFAGLLLIAIGAGGIKPCVSAHVGDQFGAGNKHLLTQIFNWFYFSINLGAASSMLLTPVLLREVGPWAAFGLPGVLMAIATFVFWLGRHKFVHVPAAGWKKWKEETFSPAGKRALLNLSPLFLVFVPMFWMIFDQTGSAWVLQADKMNRDLGIVWLPDQIQAVNPLMILTGIPIFTYIVYPLMGKIFEPTPLRKIGIGLVLTALAFCLSAVIEQQISTKERRISQQVYTDLATDAAAFADIRKSERDAAAETDEDRAMRWTRSAVSAARISKWDDAEIARYFGLTGADDAALGAALTARFENSEAFSADQAAGLFRTLAAEPEDGRRAGNLNGAVIGARNAGWDEARVVGYLGEMPSVIWQFLAYLILTSGEILVSIVCLEFAYTQSPKKMKSFIMGVYFLGVSLGNFYVSFVNFLTGKFLTRDDGTTVLDGATYYWFFAAIMGVTILVYLVWSKTYKGEEFIQGDDEAERIEAEAEAEAPDAR
ncbi:MAG: POT family MFS transporter [Phycisphaerales bacterium JB040]